MERYTLITSMVLQRLSTLLPRFLHALVICTTALALCISVWCVAASVGLQVTGADKAVVWICLSLPWLGIAASGLCIWKQLRYFVALPLLVTSSAFLAYMARDDPQRTPAPELAKLVPADSKSYLTYKRTLKGEPTTIENASINNLPHFPAALSDWPTFVAEHRVVLEQAWSHDPIAREWIDEMARHVPEGLFPPPRYNSPGVRFSEVRRGAQLRWAKFHLLVAAGDTNSAVQIILPLLQAGYHLQQASTTLVDQMIAAVLIKGCYQRLELVSETPELSKQVRQDLVATLIESPPIQIGFANAFLGEEFVARSVRDELADQHSYMVDQWTTSRSFFADEEPSAPPFMQTALGRLLFNPNRTEREYISYLHRCCQLLQERRMDELEQLVNQTEGRLADWRLKNPFGQLFTAMALPAFQKIGSHFWEVEDQRKALLARFEK